MSEHKNCPCCYGNWKGIGKRTGEYRKGTVLRKYYKCPVCGHNWSQDFTPEQPIVEHQEVILETRQQNSPNSEKPRLKPRS